MAETPTTYPHPHDHVVLAYVVSHTVAHSWHRSVMALAAYDATGARRLSEPGGFLCIKYGTGGLIEARNQAAAEFLTDYPDAQWLFWLDTDMGFRPDTLEMLLGAADPAHRPIVGALTFAQRDDEPDGMGGWRVQPTPVIYDWITVGDQSGYAVRWDYPPDTVAQCAATGSACVLIHRSVLERIRDEHHTWYDRIPNPSTRQLLSEDLSFCVRASALGIPVYVDTRVKTSHYKHQWVAEEEYIRQRVVQAALTAAKPEVAGLQRVAMTPDQAWTLDLLPETLAELGIPAKGVIHVGAHRGQEVSVYRKAGFEDITLIEPDPDNAQYLRTEFPGCAVLECAIGTTPGMASLHRAENSLFNGLRPDAGQPTVNSVDVQVWMLRDVQADYPANVLVVDTQGTELDVLASADLAAVDAIVVETQELSRTMYAAYWPDAVEALGKAGFVPAVRWEHEKYFADTLFIRGTASA